MISQSGVIFALAGYVFVVARSQGEAATAIELSTSEFHLDATLLFSAQIDGADGQPVFAAVCKIDRAVPVRIGRDAMIQLRAGALTLAEASVRRVSAFSKEAAAYSDVLRTLCEAIGEDEGGVGLLLGSVLEGQHDAPSLHGHVDLSMIVGETHLFASGWVENARTKPFVCLVDDGAIAVEDQSVFVNIRDDVSPHIEHLGRDVQTSLHGVAVLQEVTGTQPTVRFASLEGGQVRWSPEFVCERSGSWNDLKRAAEEVAGRMPTYELPRLTNVLGNLYGATVGLPVARQALEIPSSESPVATIVVPVEQTEFSVVDHLRMQSKIRQPLEWIYVASDPGLINALVLMLSARRRDLPHETRLLGLDMAANSGNLCNAGHRKAKAKYTVFLAADVYWDSFDDVFVGMEVLEQNPDIGAVGFSMSFEDGTHRHGGLELVDAMHDQGVGVARPGSMGFWLGSERVDEDGQPVAAAASGVVIVRRDDFEDDVFDTRYLLDASRSYDLGMQLKDRGLKTIVLPGQKFWLAAPQASYGDGPSRLDLLMDWSRLIGKWEVSGNG